MKRILLLCILVLLGNIFTTAYAAPFAYTVTPVRYKNLLANLYLPTSAEKVPLVIAFGGSEGGLHTGNAQGELLAPHGVAVLGLAYFKEQALPASLDQIPLEYFIDAVDYVHTVAALDSNRIGVLAGSRGTEAALLLATLDDRIHSLALTTPSKVAWFGKTLDKSAWTFKGQDIPAMSLSPDDKVPLLERFQTALKNQAEVQRCRFAVEKIHGPILLISAEQDQIWPSFQMSKDIIADLAAHHFAYPVKHFSYPTGHGFSQQTAPAIKQKIIEHFVQSLRAQR